MTQELVKPEEMFGEIDPEVVKQAIANARARDKARIDSIDLDKHYRDAIQWGDDNFAYFITDILNIGKPKWDSLIPTAAVYLPSKTEDISKFKFICNPTFAALLEPEEFFFILAHETMHILLNHLKVLPGMVKRGCDKEKVNISADAVLNCFLRDQGILPGRLEEEIIFGEKYCGYNTANVSVRKAYRDLKDDVLEKQKQMNDALRQYLKDIGVPATGGHNWIYDQGASSQSRAQEMGDSAGQDIKDMRDVEEDKSKNYSTGPGSEAAKMQRFMDNKDVSLRWAELLKHVNPDTFKLFGPKPVAAWHKPRRKLTDFHERYPDMGKLPVMERPAAKKRQGEQPAIAMFLDGSGSCSHYIQRFVTLAKSVPEDQLKLFAYSFSTYVQPLNLKEANPAVAQGGTEFSIIEDEILNSVVPKLGNYPKAVVVLTDGYGYFSSTRPKTQMENNWLWLVCVDNPYPNRCGKDMNIDKFCEGMKFNS